MSEPTERPTPRQALAECIAAIDEMMGKRRYEYPKRLVDALESAREALSAAAPDRLVERLRGDADMWEHTMGPDSPTAALEREAAAALESGDTAVHPAEWVPVGERLPEWSGWVIAFDGYIVGPARYSAPHRQWFAEPGLPINATHWMPLPPPPAADK